MTTPGLESLVANVPSPANARPPERVASEVDAEVEKQVRTWVSESFVGLLLKQMRQSPFRSELFDGGRAGQAYNALFDQHLSGRVGSGIAEPLVDGIVQRLRARSAYEQSAASAARNPNATQDATPGRTPTATATGPTDARSTEPPPARTDDAVARRRAPQAAGTD